MTIRENIELVRQRIVEACRRSSRDPEKVELVAVSKTVDAKRIQEAVDAGVRIVGENRVQEAWQKFQEVGRGAQWHMIGHLQTNKVKRVLQFADMIQSVDSVHLANEIQKQAERLDRTIEILVQVNTSGEQSKFGFAPEMTSGAVKEIATFANIKIRGLMTIGAFLPDPDDVRPCFRILRELKNKIQNKELERVQMDVLSMGMTADYEVAIEEGSTIIRVGTGIFGKRGS